MESIEEILEICEGLLDNYKSDEAIMLLNEAITKYPDNPELYNLRGAAWVQLMHPDNGIADLAKALELDSQFHLSHWHLSEVYIAQRNFLKAESHCLKAMEILPDNHFYNSTYAFILFSLKRYIECIELCSKKLNHFPDDLYILQLRADCLLNLKDYKNALADYETIYSVSAADAMLLNNLGYVYSKTGNIKKSNQYLLNAIAADPGFAYPYDNLGYTVMLEGDYKKAHEYIDKSIELDPANSYAYKNRALVFIEENKIPLAKEALHRAKALQFELYYGSEVNELIEKLCTI